MAKIDKLKNKIFGALADPKAPWYGSDLVSWVGDYIEEVEERIKELEAALDLCGRLRQDDHKKAIDELVITRKYLTGRIKDLEIAVQEWRNKADSELDINAGLHTENARLQKRIQALEALRDTVSISCHPPDDCNDPKVLKNYMKYCYEEASKLY